MYIYIYECIIIYICRAALHQGQLSKERRELKQAQANNLIDSIPKVHK